MRDRSSSSSRPALTLIEVVTALALLSTLLVGTLMAFSRSAGQIRRELKARAAAAAVDELLLGWAERGQFPPARGRGTLPGTTGLAWETRLASKRHRGRLGMDIVDLRVYADESDGESLVISIELPVPAGAAATREEVVQ